MTQGTAEPVLRKLIKDGFDERVRGYENTLHHNDDLHQEFTRLTDMTGWLKEHRDFVERNEWGFGDRAFHHMWLLLLQHVAKRFAPVKALELGVYRGQVISLWKLISTELALDSVITGVSPFEGNAIESRLGRKIMRLISKKYRTALRDGNVYGRIDYLADVSKIFATFNLDLTNVRLIKGYSSSNQIREQLQGETFSIVYIDGDHSFEGVRSDILSYCPMVDVGGYLVMDDASYFLPGSAFFKGHQSVSLACETIPTTEFVNVLNVGHNRIYQKVAGELI
ncbi:MAG TPA: class I SAM-dependent methyltransferase [Blastocatellia bacterium]|nr:class I SAM-dependent methyltransferase [Blastocatellia bacterium]